MRQISTATPDRHRVSDLGLHRCAPTPLSQTEVRSRTIRARRSRLGAELRPRMPPRLGATRPRRRRARSRERHPRARRVATRSSSRVGAGGRQQHDLGPPPQPVAVLLGLMRDQVRGLQVIQPPLHAPAVRAHKPRTLGTVTRDPAQPITGANPATSCPIEVANRAPSRKT
jgi:hypothetical protein